jgi:hypothetical protein
MKPVCTTIEEVLERLGLYALRTKSRVFLKIIIFMIHLFEWKKPNRIIEVLHTHKKLSLSELS